MKLFIVILLTISSSTFAQNQKFIFVFLNKKTDKAELPKEELDKIMAEHMFKHQEVGQRRETGCCGSF